MASKPYWLRLRGTGKKTGDWDTGRVFGGPNFKKGVEVYIGTQQGAAILRLMPDHAGQVRARLMTAQHRWPPKQGQMQGRETVIGEWFVRDPERDLPDGTQMSFFGIGREVCRGENCNAEIFWVETEAGKMMPLDAKPEKRATLDKAGQLKMIDTYTPHWATCPDAESFRRSP
jgi:hypothetical protein